MSTNKALIASLDFSIYTEGSTPKHEYVAEVLERDFIIIPKRDLPKTTVTSAGIEVAGVDHSTWPITKPTAARARQDALDYLAAALAIEDLPASRRDQITRQLSPEASAANNHQTYDDQSLIAKRAIDRIIELEDEAKS